MTITEQDYLRMQARLSKPKGTLDPDLPLTGACESERQLHMDILAECRHRGWICLHGSMAHRAHRTVGEPDFIIFADHPRLFIIEGKSRTGKLSEPQVAMLGWFTGLGWNVEIVRSFEQFLTLISAERETLTSPAVPAQTRA